MAEFLIVLLLMKKVGSFIIEFPRQTRPTKPPSNGKFKMRNFCKRQPEVCSKINFNFFRKIRRRKKVKKKDVRNHNVNVLLTSTWRHGHVTWTCDGIWSRDPATTDHVVQTWCRRIKTKTPTEIQMTSKQWRRQKFDDNDANHDDVKNDGSDNDDDVMSVWRIRRSNTRAENEDFQKFEIENEEWWSRWKCKRESVECCKIP